MASLYRKPVLVTNRATGKRVSGGVRVMTGGSFGKVASTFTSNSRWTPAPNCSSVVLSASL